MTRSVVYSSEARRDLDELYLWIARESGFPDRAERFVSAILDRCEGLGDFPFVGTPGKSFDKGCARSGSAAGWSSPTR